MFLGEECLPNEGYSLWDSQRPTSKGEILVGKEDAKPKGCLESVYVCPGRVAAPHTPLTGCPANSPVLGFAPT